MARLNRQYRRQAARQAHSEFAPQIKGARRSLHNRVTALESTEDPLNEGLDNAAATIRHSNLSATDKAQLLKSIAERQANVPAGIQSQIGGLREETAGTLADLRSEEGAQRGSILQGLLTAAAERQQQVQSEIAAEQRQSTTAIKQAEVEKALGLGDYAPSPAPSHTPLEERQERADLQNTHADTAKAEAEARGGGLTPYQQLERQEQHREDHTDAAHYAKALVEEARAGKIQGVPTDPREYTPQIWNELVTHVSQTGKVPVAAAEKAVQAVKDHFDPEPTGGIVNVLAHAAAGAVAHSRPQTPSPQDLLRLLPAATGRF